MVSPFRKIHMILMLALLVGLALPVHSASADPGGVVTPNDLIDAGWVCLYDSNLAFCMNPNFEGLGPTTVMNKTFWVSDANFSDPVYLGNAIYIRADTYAGQPCPTSASGEWLLVLNDMYYVCTHF
jgi:hypothetical protein